MRTTPDSSRYRDNSPSTKPGAIQAAEFPWCFSMSVMNHAGLISIAPSAVFTKSGTAFRRRCGSPVTG